MSPDDVKKIAVIPKFGLYDWTLMPFGLKNATWMFSITMVEVFKDWTNQFLKVFVDDVNIHSQTWEKQLTNLEVVFTRLREVNLKLNPKKCSFGAQQIVFLGHVVTRQGSYPNPKKVHVVKDFLVPKSMTNVRAFLGLTGYYRNFVHGYAKIALPLFDLTKKDRSFLWTPTCQEAFDALKFRLIEAPILVRLDLEKPFILVLDWSIKGVGSILSQKQDKHECVIAYASKGLTPSQRNFHPMEGECYALIWGIMHF
jgi:hypothetical protein